MADREQGGGRRRPSDEEILSNLPRGTGGREARLGLFVILGIVSFFVVLYWMTDPATFRGRYMLVTTVDHAGGVRYGDPVQMNGVNIGRINEFAMTEEGRVHITMEIEGRWDVPVGSETRMGSAGIFGGRTVEILPSGREAYHEEWDTLPSGGTGAADLLATAGDLGQEARHVIDNIRRLLDAETVGSVQRSARELETALTLLSGFTREQTGEIERLVASLNTSAEGLEAAAAAGPDVARAVARADSAITVLTETGANLDLALASLRSVLDRIERGEGTLGRLAHDEALYENLNSAATSITALVEDIRANPERYINVSIF